MCAEDCGYCSQAKGSKSNIERYGLLPKNQIIRQAIIAKRNNSSVFCIALSGTRPTDKEISIDQKLIQGLGLTVEGECNG